MDVFYPTGNIVAKKPWSGNGFARNYPVLPQIFSAKATAFPMVGLASEFGSEAVPDGHLSLVTGQNPGTQTVP